MIAFVALAGGVCWLAGILEGPTSGRSKTLVASTGIIVGVSLAGWLVAGVLVRKTNGRIGLALARVPRIGPMAAEFWRVVEMYRSRQASAAVAVTLSWLSDVVYVTAFYCCALTLWDGLADNPLPTLPQHFVLVPIGNVIGAIPL